MTPNPYLSFQDVIDTVSRLLKEEQIKFHNNPTAANWTSCLDVMLAHQQVCYIPKHVDIQGLRATLQPLPPATWIRPILIQTTGQPTAAAVLREWT